MPDQEPSQTMPSVRPSKISHPTGLGQPVSPRRPDATSSSPAPVDPATAPLKVAEREDGERKEIRAFGPMRRHEDEWARTPNTTGRGAIHVKSFHSKLTEDALIYMDQQINEWLDAHPQYEVKFVNANIGTFTGKIKEPQLIMQVWV